MDCFIPYITADSSLGLYDKDFNDIYHSADGALTESLEKFVLPIDFDILLKNDNLNILDICFGIGYNTKTFLNYLYKNQKKFLKRKKNLINSCMRCTETIHTDNISSNNIKNNIETVYTDKTKHIKKQNNKYTYNSSIHTDKLFNNIHINAIDNNEILFYISPFIKSNIKINKKSFNKSIKINEKYFIEKKHPKIELDNIINYMIYDKLYNNTAIAPNLTVKIKTILKKYKFCFSKSIMAIFKAYSKNTEQKPYFKRLSSNLHNIYYRYVSNRYKRAMNKLKIGNINISIKIDDARNFIKTDNNSYNLIFLDAFTPAKCPCLWSYEFFCHLHRLLSEEGMLLTYSTSASVRSAMQEAGFKIGYIYNQNRKQIGTICAKKTSLINYQLSEYDLGLLKTRAGIFYRDKNLTGQNEAIIKAHNLEVKLSNRMSTTSFIKHNKKEAKCTTL